MSTTLKSQSVPYRFRDNFVQSIIRTISRLGYWQTIFFLSAPFSSPSDMVYDLIDRIICSKLYTVYLSYLCRKMFPTRCGVISFLHRKGCSRALVVNMDVYDECFCLLVCSFFLSLSFSNLEAICSICYYPLPDHKS